MRVIYRKIRHARYLYIERNVEKVWCARYTLGTRYLSKNTVISINSGHVGIITIIFTNVYFLRKIYSSRLAWESLILTKMHVLWLPICTVCLLFSLKYYTYRGRRRSSDSFLFFPDDGVRIFFSETASVTCLKTAHTRVLTPIYAWLSTHLFPPLRFNKTYCRLYSTKTCTFALLPSTQIIRNHHSTHPRMALPPLQVSELPHKAPAFCSPSSSAVNSIRKFHVPRIEPELFLQGQVIFYFSVPSVVSLRSLSLSLSLYIYIYLYIY